nr:reverse transcriptase domain-containing protein [Tanacetum cinerariifolium]
MLPVTQIDTFYNGLTLRHRDTINAAAGGTFMKRRPEECYDLIENMTTHHNEWDTSAQRTTIGKTQNVYAAGAYQINSYQPQGSGTLPSNSITNLKEYLKGITTRSGTAYQGPTIPTTSSSFPKVVERETEVTKDTMPPTNNGSTKDVQPLVVQVEKPMPNYEPVVAPVAKPVATPVSSKKPNQKPLIPYPSRFHDQKLRDKANDQKEKFFKIFQDLNFNISFADALILIPKFCPEAITFNLDQTSRYSTNYNDITTNRIDVIDMACEVYSQEVLGFSDAITSGNPTPYYDPIVSTSSPTLTPFGDSDFLLEEVDTFLALEDDATSPEVDHPYYNPEEDILLLEAFLNDDPSLPPPTQGNYFPQVQKELEICKAKNDKSSIDEPFEVELKDLPPHLEYAFLEGDDKLLVIIAKDMSVEEKATLLKVLKSRKQAIAWKLSDIKGIVPEFCTHKILMEDDFEPAVQHQRRVISKIYDVIKKEVLKFLDFGLIYPISHSHWVSPVHCVPKNGGFNVVENEENELIPTRLVTRWRVCIDYHNFNETTRKDHFFYLSWIKCSRDQEIPIDLKDQEKTTFTYPYGTFTYRRMPFGLCNVPGTFQKCMMAIFHDMIAKMMEVFMDDFLEKSHFMVKEGIVLGHKISKNEIEVDKAKVDVITKLPHPTTVK